ncbi:MAG TPA: metalloregulator ArsR/SmtB family transcription factor [Kofleriaceae bacterium]|nr:metalloregulator ArsR/SmtB family transcription factor [Kofleriaceae bacterium]
MKALAHPTRFRMVQEIAAAGELSCGAIAEKFPVAQPTISHHLKILSDASVLAVRREGQHGIVSVNRELVGSAAALLPGKLMPRPRARRRPAARTAARGSR